MGLIKEGDKIAILSDIQGMEDFLGDMDFKVAGTEKGVTAIQMDIKIHGLSREILEAALKQAHDGRAYIREQMLDEIPAPREELSPYAPRIITIQIPTDKIRTVIGRAERRSTKSSTRRASRSTLTTTVRYSSRRLTWTPQKLRWIRSSC